MQKNFTKVKWACYMTSFSMAFVTMVSPLLFLTFKSLYSVSYTLLGLLVLINFVTQLLVDLLFSFFSHKINPIMAVKLMPFLTILGFLIYAITPYFTSNHVYFGLLIGTVLFSAASGLAEVLMSPIIVSIPSKNPDRDMSKLHSFYAWGTVVVVVSLTLFLFIFNQTNWQIYVLISLIFPLITGCLFLTSTFPNLPTNTQQKTGENIFKNKWFWLCFFAIFLGGATECTMAQWSSSYLEKVINIPKIWGDILGVALFSVMLGLGRTLYSKYGKNIISLLFILAIGSACCYLVCAICPIPIISLIACFLTGLFSSMLWPGTLIVSTDKIPKGGIMLFALMASGGDLGASVAPQLLGSITDFIISINTLTPLAQTLNISLEQLGLRIGLLTVSIFPIALILTTYLIKKSHNKSEG